MVITDMGQPVTDFLQRMDEIRMEVNRHAFLRFIWYEAHFAKYMSKVIFIKSI